MNGRRPSSRWSSSRPAPPCTTAPVVTFQPSIGTVDADRGARPSNGVATTTFLAGAISGTGKIHAFSGGARTAPATRAAAGRGQDRHRGRHGASSVSATPSSVSQSGGTVTISALVLDASDNPLPGVTGHVHADNRSAERRRRRCPTANGIARTQLTTTQTSRVTATAGAANGRSDGYRHRRAPTVTIDAARHGTVGVPVAITATVTAGAAERDAAPGAVRRSSTSATAHRRTITNVTGHAGFTHTYQQRRRFTITATRDRRRRQHGHRSNAHRDQHVPYADVYRLGVVRTHGPRRSTSTITVTASQRRRGAPPIAVGATFVNGEQVISARKPAADRSPITSARPAPIRSLSIATDAGGNDIAGQSAS